MAPMTDQNRTQPLVPERKRGPGFATTMLAVALTAGTAIAVNEVMRRNELQQTSPPVKATQVGAPFDLINQSGNRISDRNFAGRKRLMIFAATTEQDSIRAALQVINSARELAGPTMADLACLWITTDPERDTPERLSALLAETGGDWTALTGSATAIRALMRAYFVPDPEIQSSSPRPKGAPPAAVIVAYLMDENGAFLSHRTVSPDPAAIAYWLTQSH